MRPGRRGRREGDGSQTPRRRLKVEAPAPDCSLDLLIPTYALEINHPLLSMHVLRDAVASSSIPSILSLSNLLAI